LRAYDGYAQFGPLVASATETGIDVLDLESQTRTQIYATRRNERLLSLDMNGDTIVWAIGKYDENSDRVPCDYGGGLDWRIVAHTIRTGSQTTVASGRHAREIGCGAWAPVVVVDADLVAHTQEGGRPAEWQILVRSIETGEVVQAISVARIVIDVDLDGRDVAYTSGVVDDPSNPYFELAQVRLMLSLEGATDPTLVDRINSWDVSFADGRLAWATREGSSRQCWTATVEEPTPVRISSDVDACGLPLTAAGLVIYATGSETSWLGNIWDERTGLTHRFDTGMWADRLSGNGGWLVWYGEQNDDGNLIRLVKGVPTSEVAELAR
jgi:hypothetical protein